MSRRRYIRDGKWNLSDKERYSGPVYKAAARSPTESGDHVLVPARRDRNLKTDRFEQPGDTKF